MWAFGYEGKWRKEEGSELPPEPQRSLLITEQRPPPPPGFLVTLLCCFTCPPTPSPGCRWLHCRPHPGHLVFGAPGRTGPFLSLPSALDSSSLCEQFDRLYTRCPGAVLGLGKRPRPSGTTGLARLSRQKGGVKCRRSEICFSYTQAGLQACPRHAWFWPLPRLHPLPGSPLLPSLLIPQPSGDLPTPLPGALEGRRQGLCSLSSGDRGVVVPRRVHGAPQSQRAEAAPPRAVFEEGSFSSRSLPVVQLISGTGNTFYVLE